jgi:alkyl sulfatase BDS1-like metallo-beta-lactamase superfamily hydrolase
MELRHGVPGGKTFAKVSTDLLAGMTVEMAVDRLALRRTGRAPRTSC